jgi:hypothetical protein
MIEPVTDPMTATATKLFLAKRHPELAQIAQLIEQQWGRWQPTGQRPGDLTMR